MNTEDQHTDGSPGFSPFEVEMNTSSPTYDTLSDYVSKFNIAENLFILHMNIRSLSRNLDEVLGWLESERTKPDFLIFTETFHDSSTKVTNIPGYISFQSENPRNRNDGVVIYANDTITCKSINLTMTGATGLSVYFQLGLETFAVTGVYRTPSRVQTEIGLFISQLESGLGAITADHSFVLGDMNLDLLSNHDSIDSYNDTLLALGYIGLINEPTRVQGTTKTAIDHIFARSKSLKLSPAIIKSTITDHFSTALILPPNIRLKRKRSHHLKKVDHDVLRELLSRTDWSSVLNTTDVNIAANEFVHIITSTVSMATVNKKIPSREVKLTPWITRGLIKSIRIRDKLKKRSVQNPLDQNLKDRANRYRNAVKDMIRAAKKRYFAGEITKAEGNSKKTWDTIKTAILGTNQTNRVECPLVKEISKTKNASDKEARKIACDALNSYFSQVGKKLTAKFINNRTSKSPTSNIARGTAFTIRSMSDNDLEKILQSMKGKSSPGIDGIQLDLIKNHISVLKNPLLHIYNLSLFTAVFPEVFKAAKVVPIYKGGPVGELGNYRPISMLSTLSKILEKFVKNQLYSYLEENKILNARQFGFRKNVGVNEALFALTTDLYSIRDTNKKGVLIMLDIAKAFDAIHRESLMYKLQELGILGPPLEWIRSYLTNRKQVVSIGDSTSEERYNEFGVVQGSTLGPLLFLMYINEVAHFDLPNTKLYLFADDTAVLVEGDTWEDVFRNANRTINLVGKWFYDNYLTLNTSKTKLILYGGNKSLVQESNLCIRLHTCEPNDGCSCAPIERVTMHKYLGLVLDEELNWKPHIDYTHDKVKKFMYIFYNIRHSLPKESIKLVYYTMLQSVLQYGIIAWGGTYSSHINKLHVRQKIIIKIMLSLPRRTPSVNLFDIAKIFTIKQLYIKNLLLQFHKQPQIIETQHTPMYTTRYIAAGNVIAPRPRLTLTTHSPKFIVHLLHRALDSQMKLPQKHSRPNYKRQILTWLVKTGVSGCEALLTSAYVG
uniref:Putative RNA-directed DNA polymerase from transposon BS n=2 Tax=Lygus hesperus TaxID=30085 RepID=A0A0A9YPH7_LYGHE